MSSVPDSSTHHLTHSSQPATQRKTGKSRFKVLEWLRSTDKVVKVLAVIALISFIATIALVGLAQVDYVPPLVCFYALGACAASLIAIKIVECYQRSYAEKNKVDYDNYFRGEYRLPEKKKDPKKKEPSAS